MMKKIINLILFAFILCFSASDTYAAVAKCSIGEQNYMQLMDDGSVTQCGADLGLADCPTAICSETIICPNTDSLSTCSVYKGSSMTKCTTGLSPNTAEQCMCYGPKCESCTGYGCFCIGDNCTECVGKYCQCTGKKCTQTTCKTAKCICQGDNCTTCEADKCWCAGVNCQNCQGKDCVCQGKKCQSSAYEGNTCATREPGNACVSCNVKNCTVKGVNATHCSGENCICAGKKCTHCHGPKCLCRGKSCTTCVGDKCWCQGKNCTTCDGTDCCFGPDKNNMHTKDGKKCKKIYTVIVEQIGKERLRSHGYPREEYK